MREAKQAEEPVEGAAITMDIQKYCRVLQSSSLHRHSGLEHRGISLNPATTKWNWDQKKLLLKHLPSSQKPHTTGGEQEKSKHRF